MSTVPVRPLVATFKNSKEAKQAAEKHRVKSFEEHVILDVNLEGDHLKEIITSLKQAGAKKIYFPNNHQELVITVYSENASEAVMFHDLHYQELVITICLPKNTPLEILPLTNSPELAETVKLLLAFCGKPEIKIGRKIAKWVFKYAGRKIYRRTYNRSRGQFCFYSSRDRTVTGVPQQKEVKVKIIKEIN